MALAYLPIGMCEIEFFDDCTIEVDLFQRKGGVETVSEGLAECFVADNRD
jgi:hypothetical protein